MLRQSHTDSKKVHEIAGDFASLAEHLGSPGFADEDHATPTLHWGAVSNADELKRFMHCYTTEVLGKRDLATICHAYEYASRAQTRELIALDTDLSDDTLPIDLARASQHVGRIQLRKLRPLRDQRLVRRYLTAVDRGQAKAWHTVVFGVVLAVFSIPLRQGLLHYAQQTLNGLIQSSPARTRLSEQDCESLLASCTDQLPALIDQSLRQEQNGQLRLVY